MRNKARLSITGSVGENGRVLTPDCPKAVHTGPPLRQSSGLALVSSELPWKPKTSQVPYSNNNRKQDSIQPAHANNQKLITKKQDSHSHNGVNSSGRDRTDSGANNKSHCWRLRIVVARWFLSEVCGNQRQSRGNNLNFLFTFYCVATRKLMFLNQKGIHWSRSTFTKLQWWKINSGGGKLKNIMIYDKDEDQKTVNLKLKTVLFFGLLWIGKNWTTIKIVFKLNSICYTDMNSIQETTISLDINELTLGEL